MSDIQYFEEGNGAPLILLHGFCENGGVWRSLSDLLSKKYKIVAPDLPGFGKSPMLPEQFSLEDVATKLLEWMEPWKNDKPVLIGHSLGGYLALIMGQKNPEMFSGLGLFHSTAYADTKDKKQNRDRIIAFVEKNGVEIFADAFVPGLFFNKDHPRIPEIHRSAISTTPNALIGYVEAMRDRLSSIQCLTQFSKPMLFIAGENDEIINFEQIRDQSAMALHPTFHLLHECNHIGMIENTAEAAQIIDSFMKRAVNFVA